MSAGNPPICQIPPCLSEYLRAYIYQIIFRFLNEKECWHQYLVTPRILRLFPHELLQLLSWIHYNTILNNFLEILF